MKKTYVNTLRCVPDVQKDSGGDSQPWDGSELKDFHADAQKLMCTFADVRRGTEDFLWLALAQQRSERNRKSSHLSRRTQSLIFLQSTMMPVSTSALMATLVF